MCQTVNRPSRKSKRQGMAIACALVCWSLVMLLGACSSDSPTDGQRLDAPPQLTEAQKQAERQQQEETRREEARKLAEEKQRQEEVRVRTENVRKILGELPPPAAPVGKSKPPPPTVPVGPLDKAAQPLILRDTVSFDEAVPALPPEPRVRVAVLGEMNQPEKTARVALIIGTYYREQLEDRLGMAVKIAYVAQLQRNITRQIEIRYRPKFFLAAVSVASVLPKNQRLSPMKAEELSQKEVDLMVYVGRDFK